MDNEPKIPNPEGDQKDSGENQPTDYVSRRAAELRAEKEKDKTPEIPAKPEAKAQEKETVDDDTEVSSETEVETETQSEEEDNDDSDVLSQFDFEQFNEETAQEFGRRLAEKLGDKVSDFAIGLGSKVGQETGKLRSELREVKEERDKLREGLERAAPNSNAFSHVRDEKELQETEAQLVQLYDFYEDVAIQGKWEYNDNGDEGVFDQGKFYPKDQMLGFLKQWKTDLRAIPERKAQLQKRGSVKQEREKVAKTLKEKMEWFGDKESDQSKAYTELMGNPSVVSAIQVLPDLEPVLMEAFAYTVEGRSGKPRKKIDLPLRSTKTPTGGGENGALGSSRQKPKGLQQAEQRVATGQYTPDEWAAVRAQHYSKFFNKS